MATNNRHGRQLNNSYVYGNTARDIDVVAALEAPATGAPLRELEGKRREEKRSRISLGYILFLAVVLAAVGSSLVSYLNLQADITTMGEQISVSETKLNNLTLANDDEYSKMVTEVDFDFIRTVAIEELGMTYATEDQIIKYDREMSDYVHQINSIVEQ